MAETVAIIDYGSGNLHSAHSAFVKSAERLDLAPEIVVTDDPEIVRRADRLVLPGVGAYGDCRAGLFAVPGLVEALTENARQKANPFLGICVGMQLLASKGIEKGTHQGLGWIPGTVVPLTPADPALKIPHMGWNEVAVNDEARIYGPFSDGEGTVLAGHAYFVHSYHFVADNPAHVIATTDYGGPVTAAVLDGNIAGTQFHPEKSQHYGLDLIENFLKWTP
jgi:glutamine amidotransferase